MASGIPSIRAKASPQPEFPLSFETELTVEDYSAALLRANAVDVHRRRILTIALPTIWFLWILAAFAGWRAPRSRLTLSQFGDFLAQFVGSPPSYLLMLITVLILLWWAIHPWRMRRKVQRMLVAGGFTAPIPMRYRIEAAGIFSAEPHRESFVPWSRFSIFQETAEHLLLIISAQDETLPLPKPALPADQLPLLRDWISNRVGVPVEEQEAVQAPQPGSDPLVFDVTRGPEDIAATILRYHSRPALRRQRLLGFVRNWILLSLCVPSIAIAAWALDPSRVPLEWALPLFWDMFASTFWQPSLAIAGLMLLRYLLDDWFLRWFAQHTSEMMHGQSGARQQRFTLSDSGMTVSGDGIYTHMRWPGMLAVETLPTHWLVIISRGSSVPIPRHALDVEQTQRLEALFSRHISPVPSP